MESNVHKGIPIEVLVRIKPEPYQRQDLRVYENKISLLDNSDRAVDEFITNGAIFEMVDAFRSNFEYVFKKYLHSVLQGINFSIFSFGGKSSGKTFCLEGSTNESGIYSLLIENLFSLLENKRNSILEDIHSGNSPELEHFSFNFNIRMRYVEIKDEMIVDLLQKYNHLKQPVQLIYSENEGYTITGASWVSVTNSIAFSDIYTEAVKFRTMFEYNKVNKSTTILMLEISQLLENRQTRDVKFISSKINIYDCASADILAEHFKNLSNSIEFKSVYALQSMINELGKLQNSVLPKVFEQSVVTKLMKEFIGGNSLCLGIFTLQNNQFTISNIVFKLMKQAAQIMCYPIVNDSNLHGLLKKFRVDINFYQKTKELHPYDLKPPLIQGANNTNKQPTPNRLGNVPIDNSGMINDFKKKLTALEQEKIRLTEELNYSEEERIALTKSLAGLKIKYEQLRELIDGEKFDVSDKLAHIEDDIQESNKIMQTVNELHERLRQLTEDRNKLEEQLNYFKQTNENLASEIDKNMSEHNNYRLNADNEIFNLKELLNSTKNEAEYLRMEVEKYKKIQSDLMLELDERVTQFKKQLEEREREIEIKMLDLSQSEKRKLEASLREATRKVEELGDERIDYEKIVDELKKENNKLSLQNNELRSSLRDSLGKGIEDKTKDNKIDINGIKINPSSKTKLIETYNIHEKELIENLGVEKSKSENYKQKLRKLRTYTRKIRNLALDYFPLNEELPDILRKDVTVFLEDVENESIIQFLEFEIKTLRERNRKNENELERLREENKFGAKGGIKKTMTPLKLGNSHLDQFRGINGVLEGKGKEEIVNSNSYNGVDINLQKKLLEEIEKLKMTRPSTSSETTKLKKERDNLLEENKRLKTLINDASLIKDEHTQENPKYLKQKILFLEKTVQQLEKERSEFSVRATMAEEQLSSLQEHMSENTKQYQKKILELSKRLEAADLKGNRYYA